MNTSTEKTNRINQSAKNTAGASRAVGYLLIVGGALSQAAIARADMVTEWNANMEATVRAAGVPPPGQARPPAIAHAAIYDAVNGIARKYTPYFVTEAAPPGARPEAAAAQAGYATLLALFPAQKTNLDALLAQSLSEIPGSQGDSESIALGLAWGQHVADRILAWRSQDGWTNPPVNYFGDTNTPGVWRSLPAPGHPDGTLPAVFPQMATLAPFAMSSHSQFRPGPPPALASALYDANVNEIKTVGAANSSVRTTEQTQVALLWQAIGLIEENRIIRQVAPADNSLVDNARLFALVNIAIADAAIAGFDSKYTYNFWRPYHAIRLADQVPGSSVIADTNWTALVVAPRHQEYISNHAVITGALTRALAALLGDEQTFTISAPGYPGFTWTFNRFSDAEAQVKEARIWAGIHYRNSVNVGEQVGTQVADYVVQNFLRPIQVTEEEPSAE